MTFLKKATRLRVMILIKNIICVVNVLKKLLLDQLKYKNCITILQKIIIIYF